MIICDRESKNVAGKDTVSDGNILVPTMQVTAEVVENVKDDRQHSCTLSM